jgi:hypothetical protein
VAPPVFKTGNDDESPAVSDLVPSCGLRPMPTYSQVQSKTRSCSSIRRRFRLAADCRCSALARYASTAGVGSSRVLPPMNPGKTRCKPRVSRPIPLSNFVILFRRVAAVNRIAVAPLLLRCER